MASCSRFIWITNSSTTGGFELRISYIRTSYLRPIRSSRIRYLTTGVADLCWDTSTSSQVSNYDGICDPNKSWVRHHCSLKLGSKLKYLNSDNIPRETQRQEYQNILVEVLQIVVTRTNICFRIFWVVTEWLLWTFGFSTHNNVCGNFA